MVSNCTLPKVLIADDHPVNQHFMSEVCDAFGWQCDVVADGAACIDAIMKNSGGYDLILMDIHMPGTSGIEAAAQIRGTPEDPPRSIPIVAITADTSAENRSSCSKVGINRFVTKPVNIDELKSTVEDLLGCKPGLA